MCKVIAVAMQKGGCGKTGVSLNLGVGLARAGKKVLLIDNDPQGSLTASLGFEEPDEMSSTLATIMMKIINGETTEEGYGILHHQEGVDLIPGNIELSGLEVQLTNVMSRENILREYIEQIKVSYDYILIDCAPSLGMLTINALVAANSVLLPVPTAYKDNDSVLDVLMYLVNSKYYAGYVFGNIKETTYNPVSIANEFYKIHETRTDMETKAKLHHFVLSIGDANISEEFIKNLMIVVRNYFEKARFQVVVVYHSGSDDSRYNPHLHVVINHCNSNGNLYYGDDKGYCKLKDYLARCTHSNWKYIWASNSDYE